MIIIIIPTYDNIGEKNTDRMVNGFNNMREWPGVL